MYREMNQKGVAWQRFFVISKYEQKEEEKIGIIVIAFFLRELEKM